MAAAREMKYTFVNNKVLPKSGGEESLCWHSFRLLCCLLCSLTSISLQHVYDCRTLPMNVFLLQLLSYFYHQEGRAEVCGCLVSWCGCCSLLCSNITFFFIRHPSPIWMPSRSVRPPPNRVPAHRYCRPDMESRVMKEQRVYPAKLPRYVAESRAALILWTISGISL